MSRTALVVDDSTQVRAMLSLVLRKRWNYVVSEAASVAEALALFERSPDAYDVVVADFELGDGSGVELLQRLRAIRPDCCAIMVTGSSYLAAPALEEAQVSVPLVEKPFTLDALGLALEQVEAFLAAAETTSAKETLPSAEGFR